MDCIFWVWITGIFRKNFLSKRKKLQKGFQNVVSWDILPHIFVFLQRHLSRIFFLVKGDNPSTILRLRIASHSQYLLRTIFHLTWKEITKIMLFISMSFVWFSMVMKSNINFNLRDRTISIIFKPSFTNGSGATNKKVGKSKRYKRSN